MFVHEAPAALHKIHGIPNIQAGCLAAQLKEVLSDRPPVRAVRNRARFRPLPGGQIRTRDAILLRPLIEYLCGL